MNGTWRFGLAAASVTAMVLCFGCGTSGPSPASTPAKGVTSDAVKEAPMFVLTSSAFEHGAALPASTAHAAENHSPPLEWRNAPEGTKSFAITCVDLHPVAREWVHWLVVDVPAGTTSLDAGASGTSMPEGSRELTTSWGSKGWGGPEPPPGTGPHTYEFTVYALDVVSLEVEDGADLDAVVSAMGNHVLSGAKMSGTFGK